MTVIKRDKKTSSQDLVRAVSRFVGLLKDQKEPEAAEALVKASRFLDKHNPGSEEHFKAIDDILEAFEEHELSAYMHNRGKYDEWTEADELLEASSRVMSLAKRLSRKNFSD